LFKYSHLSSKYKNERRNTRHIAQPKNFPFGVNNAIELKNITATSDIDSIWRGIFQITSVLVLSDISIIFCSSIVILTPNGQFLDCVTIVQNYFTNK
jgi:hypothetical protein